MYISLWHYMFGSVFLTTAVAFLLITPIQTVGVSIAAPTDRDAVAVFALELIAVTLHITTILYQSKDLVSVSGKYPNPCH